MERMILSISEQQDLRHHEEVIERGVKTFVEVGEALSAIRDNRLYRLSHGTFEAYCRERWEMSKRHCDRLIESAGAVRSMGPIGPKITTESQARELSKVDPERRVEVIEKARESGKLTAKTIREAAKGDIFADAAVVEIEQPERKPTPMGPYRSSEGMRFYQMAWIQMEKISPKDTEREKALNKMIQYCEQRLESGN